MKRYAIAALVTPFWLGAGVFTSSAADNPLIGKWRLNQSAAQPAGQGNRYCLPVVEFEFTPTAQTVFLAPLRSDPARQISNPVTYRIEGTHISVLTGRSDADDLNFMVLDSDRIREDIAGDCIYEREK